MLHFELWVAPGKNRSEIRRLLGKSYRVARRITSEGGGVGPWVFLVSRDPRNPKTPRLRKMLGLRPNEDLWIELVFYPNKSRMRGIIKRIWKDQEFNASAARIDQLLSNRKAGYHATIAYASIVRA